MTNEEEHEKIERYFLGTLSSREKEQFELQLLLDERLAKEVEEMRVARFLLKAAGYEQFKHKLKAYSKEIEVESNPGFFKHLFEGPWKYAIAASIVIAVALSVWKITPTQNDQLFAQYFLPYPNIEAPTQMGETAIDSTTLKQKAYVAYDEGNYENAILLFLQIVEKQKDPWVAFYLGNAYLASEKPEKASVAFLNLMEKYPKDAGIWEQTQWYLMLSYLKMDEIEKAKEIGEKLYRNGNKEYSSRAKVLLEKLE